MQRQRGGGSDNVIVAQFISGTSSLCVQSSMATLWNVNNKKKIGQLQITTLNPFPKKKEGIHMY